MYSRASITQVFYHFNHTDIVQLQSHRYCTVSITQVLYNFNQTGILPVSITQLFYSFNHTCIIQFQSNRHVWLRLYNACVSETAQYLCEWNCTILVWMKLYNTCVIETVQCLCDWNCATPVWMKLIVQFQSQVVYSFIHTGIVQYQSHRHCTVSITQEIYSYWSCTISVWLKW
jgi:hypothetical protein